MIGYAAVTAPRDRDLARALGSDVLDLPVGHEWEPCEYIAQVSVRIDAAGAATLDDGIEDGAAFAGIGIAEEEPVFLFMRSFP